MRNFVRQLRKKPAHVRERMALGVTFVGSLIVVLFWVTVVRYEILPKQNLAKSRSPIQTVGDIFKNSYKGTFASVGSLTGNEPAATGEGKLLVVPQEPVPSKTRTEQKNLEGSNNFQLEQ